MTSRNAQLYADPKYPKLESYGNVTRIDNKLLGGIQGGDDLSNAKFNGCIFRHKDKLLMTYRAYSQANDGRTQVWLSELDESFVPIRNIELQLPFGADRKTNEDARLFTHKGELYVSYVTLMWKGWWAGIHVCKLDDEYNVLAHYVTQYDGNCVDKSQKNWLHFSVNDKLYMVYDCSCQHIVELDDELQPVNVTFGKHVYPPYGELRGGTTPLDIGDRFYCLAHGSLEHPTRKRRYFGLPYTFSKEAPFDILEVGSPIWASLENPIVDARATWWHPIVVFPMGVIPRYADNGPIMSFYVSMGINDIFNWVLELPNYRLYPASEYHVTRPRYYTFTRIRRYPGKYKVLHCGGMKGNLGVIKATSHLDIGLIENGGYPTVKEIDEHLYKELTQEK